MTYKTSFWLLRLVEARGSGRNFRVGDAHEENFGHRNLKDRWIRCKASAFSFGYERVKAKSGVM
jgi:hypothetical protein